MYDVIVIGGGVNGTGIARDAAMRGHRTLLVEKRDFAAGSSGANSGMIHGGLRYLQYDRKVTELSCIDSGYIQRIAPHLLFRIPFLFPIHAEDPRKPTLRERLWGYAVRVVLDLYDVYQPYKRGKPSARLTARQAYALEPSLRRDLIAAISFDEWGIDPFRLCAANAISARQHGADIRTYTEVIDFLREGGRIEGVVLRDLQTGKQEALRSRLVFNAAGPWAPKVARLAGAHLRIRGGKGVHLTLDRRISNYGILCQAADGREVFVMPHGQTSIIGTTDDDFYGDPDDIRIHEDEVRYLWEAVERTIPSLGQARILRAWAGIRPTVWDWGKPEDDLSREHAIYDHRLQGADGLLSMVGGKLASYRIMAEEAVDVIEDRLGVPRRPCRTHLEPLPGGESFPDIPALAREYGFSETAVARMAYRHGTNAVAICELSRREPRLRKMVCRCEQVTAAELVYSIRNEEARRLLDLRRRNRLGMGPCQGTDCAQLAAAVLARELGLDAQAHRNELLSLLQLRWKGQRGVLVGATAAQQELSRCLHLGAAALAELPAEVEERPAASGPTTRTWAREASVPMEVH